MSTRFTLLTSHKGVDLHAATALRVMQRHLEGGDALADLRRCELHTFVGGESGAPSVADLLGVGRYFNPNKHHYGHYEQPAGAEPWWIAGQLPEGWPGAAAGSSLAPVPDDLYDRQLGGAAPEGHVAVDVAAVPRDAAGPVISGVVWRLVLTDDGRRPLNLADRLAVARGGQQGLLVNPHMQRWVLAERRPAAVKES